MILQCFLGLIKITLVKSDSDKFRGFAKLKKIQKNKKLDIT